MSRKQHPPTPGMPKERNDQDTHDAADSLLVQKRSPGDDAKRVEAAAEAQQKIEEKVKQERCIRMCECFIDCINTFLGDGRNAERQADFNYQQGIAKSQGR